MNRERPQHQPILTSRKVAARLLVITRKKINVARHPLAHHRWHSSQLGQMQHQIESIVGNSVVSSAAQAMDSAYGLQEKPITLFGLDIADTTIDEAAKWIVERARHAIPTQISFLNADCVNIMHRNPTYRKALEHSERIFADGIGVRLAARLAGHKLRDNVNGTDLFPVLCEHAAQSAVSIYLFGARDDRARIAGKNMQRANPGLQIAGSHHGYIDNDDTETHLIDEINASGADILLVALGAPSQELWIARNRHRLCPAVVIGVGGLFDYYSGNIRRAPKMMRQVGMEWVWRLAMEPRRLARRYLLGNAEYLLRVALSSTNAPQPT